MLEIAKSENMVDRLQLVQFAVRKTKSVEELVQCRPHLGYYTYLAFCMYVCKKDNFYYIV